MFTDLLEIILSYIQFVVLIVALDPTIYPETWRSMSVIASVANLDDKFFKAYAQVIPQDFRVYFMYVGILIPLALIFFGLLALNSKKVVLWYALLLGGIVCLAVGAVGLVLKSVTAVSISQGVAEVLLVIGGCAIFVCLIAFIINRVIRKKNEEEIQSVKQLMEDETEDLDCVTLTEQILMFLALTTLGILLLGVFSFANLGDAVGSFSFTLGVICLAFAGLALIWLLVSLCVSGRRLEWKISRFASQNFMRLMLITLSILYIPVGASAMSIFNCNDFSCPSGERLVDQGSLVKAKGNSSDYCNFCTVAAGQLCPASLQASLCSGFSEQRLEGDISTQCSDMRSYFWPAAALVVVNFVLGAPTMFWFLVRTSTRILHDEFPLKGTSDEDDEQKIWTRKVAETSNVAVFLFQSFQYRFRYGRIFQLLHKLLIVITTTYVIRRGTADPIFIALIAGLVVHTAVTVGLFVFQPFLRKLEQVTATALSLIVVAVVVLTIVLYYDVSVQNTAMLVLMIFVVSSPFLFLLIGLGVEYAAARDAQRESNLSRQEKMGVQLEIVSASREETRLEIRLAEIRAELMAETQTQKRLERSSTAAARDTMKKSKERMDNLTVEVEDVLKEISILQEYRSNLESGTTVISDPGSPLKGETSVRSQAPDEEAADLSSSQQSASTRSTGRGAPPRPPSLKPLNSSMKAMKSPSVGSGGGSGSASPSSASASPKPPIAPRRSLKPIKSALPEEDQGSARLLLTSSQGSRQNLTTLARKSSIVQSSPSDSTALPGGERADAEDTAFAGRAVLRRASLSTSGSPHHPLQRQSSGAGSFSKALSSPGSPKKTSFSESPKTEKPTAASTRAKVANLNLEDEECVSSSDDEFDVATSSDDEESPSKSKNVPEVTSIKSRSSIGEVGSPLKRSKSVFSEAAHAVKQLLDAERAEEKDAREAVDHRINEKVQSGLNRFLMGGGIIGFIALGFALLGIITASTQTVATSSDEMTTVVQFAGYDSWDAMTRQCCCIPFNNSEPHTNAVVEKWACQSGAVLERIRAERTVDVGGKEVSRIDGFAIRPFCGVSFIPGTCLPNTSSSDPSLVHLNCSASVPKDQQQFW